MEDYQRLYKAVQEYIESKNGQVLAIGGIQVTQFPDDLKYNYRLCIKVTGIMPEYVIEDGDGVLDANLSD